MSSGDWPREACARMGFQVQILMEARSFGHVCYGKGGHAWADPLP